MTPLGLGACCCGGGPEGACAIDARGSLEPGPGGDGPLPMLTSCPRPPGPGPGPCPGPRGGPAILSREPLTFLLSPSGPGPLIILF